ncbi:MAG: beta-galactosidase trimerization domain-containing protein [Anaerolineae bacterium]|nr:beta-galactosidase trimerization domain-containing protein [Anaerolineae bacterium]
MRNPFAPTFPRPDWINEPLIFVGHWEPLIFRRRRGGQATDETERYAREHSDEAIRAIKEAGANLVITHFDKGFGLTAEADDIAMTRDWIARLRAHGLRTSVYIRYDTVVSETLLYNQPDAAGWIGRTSNGTLPVVLHQVYRNGACPNAEDHLIYIESLVKLAIDDFRVDLIHFDGFWLGHENWACHCDHCQADFTRFLRARYPDDVSAMERFGHRFVENLRPPAYQPYDAPLEAFNPVKDPIVQEWIWYRNAKLMEIARRLRTFIYHLNPQVAMEINSLIPIGYNNAYYWGFDLPSLAPHIDALWTEDDHWAGWRDDGVLISRIREFKIGERLGSRVFSYQRGRSADELRLSLAQAMVFQPQSIGMIGTPLLREEAFYTVKQSALEWFRCHIDWFKCAQSAAEIAILRSQNTLAFNSTSAQRSVILAEQMLIQGGIPFDIIYDADLEDLSRWRVLVLPNVECLSDKQIAQIRAFVQGGGGMLATELTGLWDEYRRQRPQPGLLDLYNENVRYLAGDLWEAPRLQIVTADGFSQTQVDAGRAAFIPAIQTQRPSEYAGVLGEMPYRFGTERWEMPLNSRAFHAALRWISGGTLQIETDAPEGLAIEVRAQDANRLIVHLIDYQMQPQHKPIALRLRTTRPVRTIYQLAFEQEPRQPLAFTQHSDNVSLTVSAFNLYSLLAIELLSP